MGHFAQTLNSFRLCPHGEQMLLMVEMFKWYLLVTGTNVHEVCEGEDVDVIFDDITDFNCNAVYPANYPPNDPIQTPQ